MNASRPRSRFAAYADALEHWAVSALQTARLQLMASGVPLKRRALWLTCMDGPLATGLFSEFMVVLGALDHYERWPGCYAGLSVDYGLRGLYAEPAAGPNWWEYFFAPLRIPTGAPKAAHPVDMHLYRRFAEAGETLPRGRAHELTRRYIRPAPRLEQRAGEFAAARFGDGFVLGVHYRGTDKRLEAPRVSYDAVDAAIQRFAAHVPGNGPRIFVATDESAFLDHMLRRYPGRVVCRKMFRSADGRPIHHVNEDGNHKKGEDAVLDCLLLSRCNGLVRTASALGLCATYLNPEMPVVLLNREAQGGPLTEWARRGIALLAYRAEQVLEGVQRSSRFLLVALGLPLQRPYLVLGSRGDGLFSEFAAVLGLLNHYEAWRPAYAGLRVDFADRGRYFDPSHGPNWWEYHFERIELGSAENAVPAVVSGRQHDAFAARGETRLSRARGAELISRHIRPRPHIRARVDAFARDHFGDAFVVGVHYRGTDKSSEAPRVPYERVREAVLETVRAAAPARYRVFVATDESAFLDFMRDAFPEALACCEMPRSLDGAPLHGTNVGSRRLGEDAVADCLLLARANFLVRTASNLGLCASFFNPDMPVVELRGER